MGKKNDLLVRDEHQNADKDDIQFLARINYLVWCGVRLRTDSESASIR